MNLVKRLLTRGGIVVAVSFAVMTASVGHATMASISGLTGASTNITTAQEEADESLDVRIKQAIAELREEARAALVELGELDTPEKAEAASLILQRLAAAIEKLNMKLHNPLEERLDEQNDLALARIYQNSAAEAKKLGQVTTLEQIEQIDKIRTVWREKVARIEEHFGPRLTGLEERHSQRTLPKFDLGRQGRSEPASDASEEAIAEFIAGLREMAEAAVENLGELDTPGKTQRAENIRLQTERRIEQIENPSDEQAQDHLETKFAQRSEVLEQRSQAAVDALGKLDTPEKAEEAFQIRTRTLAAINLLNQRMGVNAYRMDQQYDAQFEEKAADLKQRTQDWLKKLGVLDTQRKFYLARLLQSRLDDAIRQLKSNLIKAKRQAQEDLTTQTEEQQ